MGQIILVRRAHHAATPCGVTEVGSVLPRSSHHAPHPPGVAKSAAAGAAVVLRSRRKVTRGAERYGHSEQRGRERARRVRRRVVRGPMELGNRAGTKGPAILPSWRSRRLALIAARSEESAMLRCCAGPGWSASWRGRLVQAGPCPRRRRTTGRGPCPVVHFGVMGICPFRRLRDALGRRKLGGSAAPDGTRPTDAAGSSRRAVM